jgi:hypothetical protein
MARPKKNLVKTMKKLSREAQLAREKIVGKPRAKTFGGPPTPKEMRRIEKRRLRDLDSGMD